MNQSEARWLFVKQNPNYRVKSTTLQYALGGTELTREARVVREAIQNSVDATNDSQKTHVSIWNETVSSDRMDVIRGLIGCDGSNNPFSRLDSLGLQPGNALERMKDEKSEMQDFVITVIEDRNTCGLGYDESTGIDRFDELCLSFGQDETVVDPDRGGSYGFGKSVYEEASDCKLFFVYSVFEPNSSSAPYEPGSHARLFACANFKGHVLNGINYPGRALFGLLSNGAQPECRPIVDEKAHEVAEQLGFVRRDPSDTGTSIMIIGTNLKAASLKSAIEDWWWPRLYSNQLSVELKDQDTVFYPDPKDRKDLSPYLRCYSLIAEGITKKPNERVHILKSNQPLAQHGRLALTPMPQAEDESDDSEEDSYLKNTIALIRSRPQMVVKYLDPSGRSTANFCGVFVSHPDIERELHISEPSSHNDWSPESTRFVEAFPNDVEKQLQAKNHVKTLLDKIKNHARAFRRAMDPVVAPVPVAGSRTVQTILAQLMSGGSPGPKTPPQSSPDPFTVNIQPGGKNSPLNSQVTAKVDIALNDRSPVETAEATLSIEPFLTMDDDLKRDSQGVLPLRTIKLDGEELKTDGNSFSLTIRKDKTSTIEVSSLDFPRALYAGLDVHVKIDELESTLISVEEPDSP